MSETLSQRYALGELVGRGGTAQVYRGRDRTLDRPVAVKLFRPQTEETARRRIDDEAIALARLSHPGLAAIYDVGLLDDQPFLVMEFIEGESLESTLLSGSMRRPEALRMGAVLAEALAHAHERGVVHRDVKPSNIILDHDGLPHLTDFGIALLADAPRLTNAHDIIGTPAYLAPEQVLGHEIEAPADVYSLALVLLESLTGEVEYPGETNLAAAMARLTRPPRIPADLPPAVAELFRAMTASEPGDRPTAQDCADRLLAIAEDHTEPAAWWADADRTTRMARVPALVPVPQRSRHTGLIAATVGVAAVAAALVFLLHSPTTTPPRRSAGSVGTGPTSTTAPARLANPGPVDVAHNSTPVATVLANATTTVAPTQTTTTAPTTTTAAPTTTTAPVSTTTSPPPTSTSAPTTDPTTQSAPSS